ncbi:PQQ-binding-like beta-propeller repeat protein [Spirosoma sp. 209]|uniref:outer membrane protein assembly factor BamB family protein n=1 Tax=Spirosoma sp. 209 TaxID=1955701 RepID=UPI00098D2A9F|nr:PQQ-binding-like beta-propeller repeat protein [Spirosoma sp. 209]
MKYNSNIALILANFLTFIFLSCQQESEKPSSPSNTSPVVSNSNVSGTNSISVVVSADYLFTSGNDGKGKNTLFCLDPKKGTLVWKRDDFFVPTDRTSFLLYKGILFVAGAESIYALNANTGLTIWKTSVFSSPNSPCIVDDLLYIYAQTGNLYAIDANNGKIIWTTSIGSKVSDQISPSTSSPTVVNNILYVGGGDGRVYAVDAKTGSKKWDYSTGGSIINSSPAVVNGTVYIGSSDKKIYALDANTGLKKWDFQTKGSVTSSPTVAGDKVFIGSFSEIIYALNANNGEKIWQYQIPDAEGYGYFVSSPIVVNNCLYIGSTTGRLFCFDSSKGTIKWLYKSDPSNRPIASIYEIKSSPIVANGLVYVNAGFCYTNKTGAIIALNAEVGGLIWSFSDACGEMSPVLITKDGKTYHSGVSGMQQ